MNWQFRTTSALLSAAALFASGATTPALSRTPTAASSATASAPAPATSSASPPAPSRPTWWASRWRYLRPSRSRTGADPRPSSCNSWRWFERLVAWRVWPAPSKTPRPSSTLHDGVLIVPSDGCPVPLPSGGPATPAMAALTPREALQRLRSLYRDAMKVTPLNDESVLEWARRPEHWATHQIAHRGWSYLACEAVVRQCRILLKRATIAAAMQPVDDGPEVA